ncbi:MAG: NAD/NADP octopine/nopaline dehydrogenase family protein [Paludibacteraceae bacterium]|nr:NAD/NADP octopine/nopaline dehydrogenase family protein [Paludibacteraceae bacterium]
MKTVCICGGGSLGHVIAGWLSSKQKAKVNILTSRPTQWSNTIKIYTPEKESLEGEICKISSVAEEVIPLSDIVLLCVPGFLIKETLLHIKQFLNKDCLVGCVFSSTGFFFEAKNVLEPNQPLWGFQRVPFIARVIDYGKSANLLGFKDSLNIAVENVSQSEKVEFTNWIESVFEKPTHLLNNYLEASLTNSNPLLHTSRLYSLFANRTEPYERMIRFYEEWNDESSDLLVKMDEEFFKLLEKLPVAKGFLSPILDYYECKDAASLTKKIISIQSFKGIESPMKETINGWIPDFESRYFTEDFSCGLKYIWSMGKQYNVDMPHLNLVYEWGSRMLNKCCE